VRKKAPAIAEAFIFPLYSCC